MLWLLGQIFLGVLVGNGVEWLTHKFILHGLGRRRSSAFSFHWHGHHRTVRKLAYLEPDYLKPWYDWNGRTKEIAGLAFLAALCAPVSLWAPVLYGTLVVWTFLYYHLHRLSHLNPEFGKRWMRWHYDHHMGPNQNSNWGVVLPLWDILLGTRIHYVEKP